MPSTPSLAFLIGCVIACEDCVQRHVLEFDNLHALDSALICTRERVLVLTASVHSRENYMRAAKSGSESFAQHQQLYVET